MARTSARQRQMTPNMSFCPMRRTMLKSAQKANDKNCPKFGVECPVSELSEEMVVKIWQFWDSVNTDGKYKRVVCKFCHGHEQIKHAAKCRRHTITCVKVPKSIKDMLDLTVSTSRTVFIESNSMEQCTSIDNDVEEVTAVEMITSEPGMNREQRVELATEGESLKNETNAAQNNSHKVRREAPRVLAKGGRNRNSNILSAALCLIKELDIASLEVLDTAIHCRMEEIDQSL